MTNEADPPAMGPARRGRNRQAGGRTLRSLRNRNYRMYLMGLGLSNTGMWVQQTAELWLILQLTGSGMAVGIHSILRFGPVLLFGAMGGLLSDRVNRRRLLILTQTCMAVGAVVITVAAWMDSPSLLLIYGVVLWQGLVNAVDNPLRRAFVRDLVADEDLANAVSLQSSMATSTRAVGPAIAGLLIAQVGVPWCFTINAVSYVAIIVVLFLMDTKNLRPQVLASRGKRLVRQGIAYAWERPRIRESLLLCLVVGVFGWNWPVLVPFYATEEFSGGASLYGAMLSALSFGAVTGTLLTARLSVIGRKHLLRMGVGLVVSMMITVAAPTLSVAFVALFLLGATVTALVVASQARIQLEVDDAMSGRVLALFSVVFVGSKPFGGLVGGWLTDVGGARVAFGISAAAIVGALLMLRRAQVSDPPDPNASSGANATGDLLAAGPTAAGRGHRSSASATGRRHRRPPAGLE